jgi:uncharacterized protein
VSAAGIAPVRAGLGALRAAVLVASALLAAACTPPEPLPPLAPPPPLPERPEIPYGSGLLWQVTKDRLEPSYVFGTMHVPDPEFVRLQPVVQEAFDESSRVALEIAMEDDQAFRHLIRYVTAAMLPEGESLEDLIGSHSYAQLVRIASRQKPSPMTLGSFHISRFKPWFVMDIVGADDATASHLDRSRPFLDVVLGQRARKAGKTVVGLETFEEHLALDNDMAMDDQVALLKSHLADMDRRQPYAVLAETYRNGDTAMMVGLWRQSLASVEEGLARRYTERFLDDRNRSMVERALPLIAQESTFIAVGALHLPGEAGILRLLEQRGFTVTRLH